MQFLQIFVMVPIRRDFKQERSIVSAAKYLDSMKCVTSLHDWQLLLFKSLIYLSVDLVLGDLRNEKATGAETRHVTFNATTNVYYHNSKYEYTTAHPAILLNKLIFN